VREAGAEHAQAVSSPVRTLRGGDTGPSQLHGLLTGGVRGSGDNWDGAELTGRRRKRWLGRTLLLVRPLPLAVPVSFVEAMADELGDELVQGTGTLPPRQSVLRGLP